MGARQGCLQLPFWRELSCVIVAALSLILLAVQGVYTFHDSLKFSEGDWTYCDEDDRRFYTERVGGIQPAGESTN